MPDVNQQVREVLERLIADGLELGAQVAAYLDGELVVDTWAGLADKASGKPVDGDTLFTVFSTTKGPAATCMHMLAERGQLDYDAPISKYWPEFAAHGKEKATVRHALTHRAGVPQLPLDITPAQMCDWDGMCRLIADSEPLWEPGTKTGYHAYTFGWILGEMLRRIDGRPMAEFLQQEICRPLGVEALYMGIPDAVEPRVATLHDAPPPENAPQPPPDALIRRAIPETVGTNGKTFNRADVRRASMPAVGGITNARSIARFYAALANGGTLDGATVLPPERISLVAELQTDDVDAVIGVPMRKGLGYFLGGPLSPMGTGSKAFGHPGANGSIGFADPERRFAFGYTKNLCGAAVPQRRQADGDQPAQVSPPPSPAYIVAEAVRSALGIA